MVRKTTFMRLPVYIATAIITVGLFCSFCVITKGHEENQTAANAPTACQGKHCSYTVGCDCPGFSPKTNGDVWEKAYCKHCGHHKKYHR